MAGLQLLNAMGVFELGFENWQPTLFAYVAWATCLTAGQVIINGEMGKRALFVLPAALFVISLTIIPLAFGLAIAFSDWNLSAPAGPSYAGLDNIEKLLKDTFYWNAMLNMVFYVGMVLVEYAIAFGLALLLHLTDPGAALLPSGLPHPTDALAGGGVVDDRQVHAGSPLRAAGAARAQPGHR